MKPIKLTIMLFISVILFSGCLKVNSNVIINKDGSGILEEQVLMSDMVISMMNEFMSSFEDSTSAPEEFKLFKEDELEAKASEYGEGVRYVSGEEIKIDGWQGYKAIYSFEDLNMIKMETDPNTKVENPQDGQATEHFSFKFTPGDIAELIIDRPELNSIMEDEDIFYGEYDPKCGDGTVLDPETNACRLGSVKTSNSDETDSKCGPGTVFDSESNSCILE